MPVTPATDERPIIVTASRVLTLKQFAADVRRHGVQQSNRYTVRIDLPTIVPGDVRILRARCFSTVVPGKQMMTKDDVYRYGRGPVDTVPYGTLYAPIPLSFILDDKGIVQDIFNRWMTAIVDADSSEGMTRKYEVEYKDNYVTTVSVQQHDMTNLRTMSYDLNRAYPIALGDISVGWDQGNQVSILPVTFAYRDYKPIKSEV